MQARSFAIAHCLRHWTRPDLSHNRGGKDRSAKATVVVASSAKSASHHRARCAACYPQPSHEVGASSQRCVCSSVQPGTAKCAGAVAPWLGRMMRWWPARWCAVARCAGAASAGAHNMITKSRARTPTVSAGRIALLPFTYRRPLKLITCCAGRAAGKRSQRRTTGGTRRRAGTASAGGSEGLRMQLPASRHVVADRRDPKLEAASLSVTSARSSPGNCLPGAVRPSAGGLRSESLPFENSRSTKRQRFCGALWSRPLAMASVDGQFQMVGRGRLDFSEPGGPIGCACYFGQAAPLFTQASTSAPAAACVPGAD